jgi:ABC-type nitrate/sulfonate/bicarbonate transport system ATPase subunit
MAIFYEEKEVLIKAEGVCLSYDTKNILKDINFEIRNIVRPGANQGQIIAFLGRSGRGKSSLFKLITGLEKPTLGSIMIPDFKNNKNNPTSPQAMKNVREGDVGFVDQKYTLFRHKTVFDALKFALRNSEISDADKEIKINKYLEDWGLMKNKNQYPNELSGGQRQRTAIIEQLLSSSNFLIMDEPFSGLDIGNIQNVKNAFKLIDQSDDLNTILFSTHDVDLAVELADCIYILGYRNDEHTGVILEKFDLKALGLAWSSDLTMEHYNLMKQIKNILLES